MLCAAALAAAIAMPAGAGARSASGLACLQGSWISNGIRSSAASGLAGIRLTITNHGRYASATSNYDYSSAIHFHGSQFVVYIRGSSSGRFRYTGHGHYSYALTGSNEKESGYIGSTRVTGPAYVSGQDTAHYTGLRCTGSGLTDKTVVPTRHGPVTVTSSFRRG